MDTIEQKQKLRRDMQFRRQQLPLDQRLQWQAQIYEQLSQLLNQYDAKTIAAYRAFNGEPDLDPFIFSSEYNWTFPCISEDSMSFYAAKNKEDFCQGRFGISEPRDKACEISLSECEMVLVPGVAFDNQGRRLGMGKGYYDKALSNYRGIKVGVAFNFQFVAEPLPYDSHDIFMDFVLTEKVIFSPIQHKRIS